MKTWACGWATVTLVALAVLSQGCSGCGNQSSHQVPDGGAPDVAASPDGPPAPDGPPGVDGSIPTPPLIEVPLDSPPGATTLTRTVVTDIYDATRFLWDGANPAQVGVAPTTIDRLRVAVVRGRLLDETGAPLAGATVAVLGHAELGSTTTRTSGGYDLVVNGGQRLVVTFGAAGLLPAQRQLQLPVRDYVRLPDVRLLPHDGQGTSVDPSSAADLLVARGSPVTDGDGTRQATLLFTPGTTATMTLPGGSTATLPGPFTVRATEYTVGPDGPAAMPAQLPPSSGYTYAVELSVDEAEAAGATSVVFDQPVVVYVDNFLNFLVGGAVPVGFYDRTQGIWVPASNGRTLALLGATGGLADLDLDGDGVAAGAAALAAAGISEAERRRLAEQYPAPTSLWRAQVTHFSAWDCNWPFGPPVDAVAPNMGLPTRARCKGGCERSGSIIECENQTLAEELPLSGTAAFLRYQSDRVLGRTASLSLDIPVSPASLPASAKRIEVEVEVAGRKFTTAAPPLPNQVARFVWDGKDAYGRLLQGAQPVLVRIGYVYDGTYQTAEASSAAFGAISGTPIITGDATRQEITLWQELATWLGLWDAAGQGLGGWSLSAQHVYDPINRIAYLGTGEQVDATGLGLMSERVAGTTVGGYTCDFGGDGGLATAAQLYGPSGVAFGPDGSLYIADQSNGRIRRVDGNGIITTVAGTGSGYFDGDGGPAVQASLYVPQDVAVAPDGTLYIADMGNNRIRRVTPDGIISTYAGTGVACTVVVGPGCGDGGPALQADLGGPWRLALGPDGSLYLIEWSVDRVRRIAPDGTITHLAGGTGNDLGDGGPASLATLSYPTGLAVGPDGSVYIADEEHGRVRRVGPDGIMRTVAGSAQGCDPANDPDPTCGDGGPALSARFGKPSGVAVARDGTIFVADSWTNRVRKVSPDGIITSVAGTGATCDETTDPTCGDGALALQAAFTAPVNLALDAAENLYVIEDTGCRIRRLRSPLTGTSLTDIVVPSADASEVWVFDARGRHQRTLDALTGSVRVTFAYDGEGRLSSVTDPFGNTVTLERGAGGAPAAIVAPFGQRTTLTLDANGYLASVADPLGQTVQLVHGSDGLLTQLTDGRGGVHQFAYDDRGRLVTDTDPTGGALALARTETPTGWQVTIQSAAGRTTRYLTETSATGEERRQVTLPGGPQSVAVRRLDGTAAVTHPDGTQATQTAGPDVRFGMSAPQLASATLRTPGGLELDVSSTTTATLANPLDLLSLQSLARTTVVNGRTSTAQYLAATRQWTYTSPAGRQQTLVLDANGRVIQAEPLRGMLPVQVGYDGRGRIAMLTQGTGPTARQFQLGYDASGTLVTVADPDGRQTSFVHDPAGRVVQEILPDTSVVGFAYDANGNVTAVTPPSRPAHNFSYTPGDLLASYVPPDVGTNTTTTYAYNGDRQLTAVTRPDGTSVILAYDGGGRLATVTLPRGTVDFTYDSTSGSLARVTAPDGGALAFTYDGILPIGVTSSGAVAGTIQRVYDNDLRVTAEDVAGSAVAFAYDDDGLLVQAGDLAVTRDAQNGLPTVTALGEVTTTTGYDGFGDVASFGAQFAGSGLLAVNYARDRLGRITTRTETVSGTTTVFGYAYDSVGRLIQVTTNGTATETYAYDSNGNRPGCTTDAQDRMSACSGASYGYNANGDLRTKTSGGQTATYDYDADGALRGVSLTDGRRIDYVLDGFGRRIGKRVDGVLVQAFIYRDALRLAAELDGWGNVVARFVYDGLSTTPSYFEKDGATYRLLTDHVGSPRLVVDIASGVVVQQLDYDAFGRVSSDSSPGYQPFGFAGGLYDPDTKLVRFGARDYDAETGRWTTKDPIGFNGDDSNLYGYVLQDPVNLADPTGQDPRGALGRFIEIILNKSGRAGGAASIEDLIDVARHGGDVLAKDEPAARRIAKALSQGGRQPTRHPPHCPGGRSHYHPSPKLKSGPHIFWQILVSITPDDIYDAAYPFPGHFRDFMVPLAPEVRCPAGGCLLI